MSEEKLHRASHRNAKGKRKASSGHATRDHFPSFAGKNNLHPPCPKPVAICAMHNFTLLYPCLIISMQTRMPFESPSLHNVACELREQSMVWSDLQRLVRKSLTSGCRNLSTEATYTNSRDNLFSNKRTCADSARNNTCQEAYQQKPTKSSQSFFPSAHLSLALCACRARSSSAVKRGEGSASGSAAREPSDHTLGPYAPLPAVATLSHDSMHLHGGTQKHLRPCQ